MKRLLIIDDDAFMRLGLATVLKKEGFELRVADNGVNGLAIARSFLPDLIICDIMMPLMNGLQLKTRLNQDETLAHIPLIFVSGRDKQEEIDYALSIGAEGYLVKPVVFDALLNKIKSILRIHRRYDPK